MLSLFGSKKPVQNAPALDAQGVNAVAPAPLRRAPAVAPRPAALPSDSGGVEQADSGTSEDHVFASYADVPKFQRVLTDAESPIFKLEANVAKSLVAIELAGRKALVIASTEPAPPATVIESMRGIFIAANYDVLPLATTSAAVIAEIYSAGSVNQAGAGARGANIYMATVHEWISYAVENRATDIHIEVRGSVGQVRFRIDGELEVMKTSGNGVYPAALVEKAMGSLFNNEQQRKSGSDSLFDPNKNLYCMVPYSDVPGHTLKLRYQSLKGNEGPKTILRLLPVNENAETLTFEQLGYESSQIKLWNAAMQTPSGAILIAGVTGSGKSTTQKSFIELNPNAAGSAIYTVEDPVEYPIRHTHQVPIQRDVSNPEASARMYGEVVAALMRADPDVVMLGEIRDRPSANAMQQLVETGHMGLGTVHAHLLSGIVPRLVNPEIGMHREILTGPNMVTLLVYQALVPKLCPHCAIPTGEARGLMPEVDSYVEHMAALDLPTTPLRWKKVGGCEHCKGRGTVGLSVVAEMIMPDEDWLRPIREVRDVDAVEAYRSMSDRDLTSANMDGKTVFEHTLFKSLQGQVDLRQCSRFDNFHRFVNRYKRMAGK